QNVTNDNAGPLILLFMNDRYFINGGTTDENPLLIATVSDESGINTVGTGIGHDLTAILDDNLDNPFILNDYYESDVNTFESGKIIFPLVGLPEGKHRIVVRAWDVHNNSSEAAIDFAVVPAGTFVIENPLCFPNPFSEYTDVTYSHNQQGKMLKTSLHIYTITGKPVVTLEQERQDFGSRATPVRWDGRDSDGNKVAAGMFIYKIISSTADGLSATLQGKLIYNK
ncbi:MAG TPA: hypothetical protein PLP88_08950, partial [Bacteroidales bacterium]|nr:hypothetical protein [Bacteroidales bacterium]